MCMSVTRVFYVNEIGEEGSILYDAVDDMDAYRQHCAGDNGAEPDADRSAFAIGVLDANMIEEIRSDLEAHHYAILAIVKAHRKGEPLDELIERAAGVIGV